MGYIRVPKLGSSDEPVINAREMPQEWQYYKTLAESNTDQCYLFYKGASATFTFLGLVDDAYLTLYGGSDGMQPLYRCFWATNASDRYWAKYINGQWVRNTNQPTSMTYCYFRQADLDNYSEPFPITLKDLQGKPITNDSHLGTTELFTVVIHQPNSINYNNAKLYSDNAVGATSTNSTLTYPLVAYYGSVNGIKASDSIRTPDLEFIEFSSVGTTTQIYFAKDSFWLGKLVIPDNATTLNEKGCLNTRSLQEVTLPKDLLGIPTQMFNNCMSLKKVNIGNKVQTIGESCFRTNKNLKKIALPSTIETIGQYAFSDSGIENIELSSSLTTIENYAFQNTNIKEVVLPDNLQNLGIYAFTSCKSLETVHLPNTITSISQGLFSECNILKDINFPSSLTSIGAYSFNSCNKLSNVVFPSSLTSIGDHAFYNCYNLEEIVIPSSCSVDSFAFGYCDNLKKVTLPAGFTTLNASTFVQCRSLEEITLPDSLLSIGGSAFSSCYNLKSLVIPENIMSIAASAFAYMGACRYFKLMGNAPTLANANAFGTGNTYVKILIPYEYIDNYQTSTNWSSATNNVKRKQRGFKTFNQGDLLPSTDLTETYDLTWYDDFNAILNATATGTPSATPVTTASHDGEYYCLIS